MSDDLRERLYALNEAASPAPWRHDGHGSIFDPNTGAPLDDPRIGVTSDNDAALIVELRNAYARGDIEVRGEKSPEVSTCCHDVFPDGETSHDVSDTSSDVGHSAHETVASESPVVQDAQHADVKSGVTSSWPAHNSCDVATEVQHCTHGTDDITDRDVILGLTPETVRALLDHLRFYAPTTTGYVAAYIERLEARVDEANAHAITLAKEATDE